ncbi:unnamed protein product, partial [Linum tenue]
MDFNGMRDLESEKQICAGHCRVSRLWLGASVTTDKVLHLDMILMDSKGNDIWVHIPPVLQEHFKALLQEQEVYIIKDYEIHTTQLKYRPIANSYIMTFNRTTTVQRVPDIPSIPTFKFSFTKASEMKDKLGQIIILSDVVGELVKHSNLLTTTNLSRKTTRKELELKLIEGDVVKVVIWGRVITEFDKIVKPAGDQPIILVVTAVSVNLFKKMYNQSSPCMLSCPHLPPFLNFRCLNCWDYMWIRTARYRIQLEVEANSKSATFIIFEYEGKRFFGPTANELFNRTGQNYEEPPADLLKVVGVTKLFHVKFKPNLYSDAQPDFTVLKILEPEAT